MKITEHNLADLRRSGPIKCLCWASKTDRIEGENNPDHPLGRAILRGDLKMKHGQSIWWLDENFQQHACRVEHDEIEPEFKMVSSPGCEVIVKGFAHYQLVSGIGD